MPQITTAELDQLEIYKIRHRRCTRATGLLAIGMGLSSFLSRSAPDAIWLTLVLALATLVMAAVSIGMSVRFSAFRRALGLSVAEANALIKGGGAGVGVIKSSSIRAGRAGQPTRRSQDLRRAAASATHADPTRGPVDKRQPVGRPSGKRGRTDNL